MKLIKLGKNSLFLSQATLISFSLYSKWSKWPKLGLKMIRICIKQDSACVEVKYSHDMSSRTCLQKKFLRFWVMTSHVQAFAKPENYDPCLWLVTPEGTMISHENLWNIKTWLFWVIGSFLHIGPPKSNLNGPRVLQLIQNHF